VADAKKDQRFTWKPGDLRWADSKASAQKLAEQAKAPKKGGAK
jgi:hypothetical protein